MENHPTSLAPVPLRPGTRRWLARQRLAEAKEARAQAHLQRRKSQAAPDDYWRERFIEAATDSEARAAAHERAAERWLREA